MVVMAAGRCGSQGSKLLIYAHIYSLRFFPPPALKGTAIEEGEKVAVTGATFARWSVERPDHHALVQKLTEASVCLYVFAVVGVQQPFQALIVFSG